MAWYHRLIGRAAQGVGRAIDYATPGSGTGKITKVGRSIVNPDEVYVGGGLKGFFDRKPSWQPRNSIAPNVQNIPPASPYPTDPNQSGDGSQWGGGQWGGSQWGGGEGYTAQRAVDLTPYRNNVISKIQAIQRAYDELTGDADRIANEKSQFINQNYDSQFDKLNKSFAANAQQQANAYGARGLGSSSYYTNAQNEANDVFNTNIADINRNRSNDLAQVGQFLASNKGQFQAAKNQYQDYANHIGDYDQAGLMNLDQQLGSALAQVQAQRAGFGTQSDFINKLNAITPVQNHGAETLAANLQKLVAASAPKFAKDQIAQGLIKQAQIQDPNAQNYWTNYYKQLLGA
jgi:hypothetical protein